MICYRDPLVHALQFLDVSKLKDLMQKEHFYRTTLKELLPYIPKVEKTIYIKDDRMIPSARVVTCTTLICRNYCINTFGGISKLSCRPRKSYRRSYNRSYTSLKRVLKKNTRK